MIRILITYILASGCHLSVGMAIVANKQHSDKILVCHEERIASHPSRRSLLLLSTLSVMTPMKTSKAQSEDSSLEPPQQGGERERKPFAPPGALLPAARLKIVVDQLYNLSTSLTKTTDKNIQYQTLQKMNQLWTNQPPLFSPKDKQQPSPTTPPSSSSAQLNPGVVLSPANKQQYQNIRKDLSLSDRMAAILNQADIQRQWGMLRYQESKREQTDQLRAAFNFYTSRLEFGSDYLFNASPTMRKQMIRNDELPSLTAVITSDLDLRDLYRNDFLTAMEDTLAEISYQLKQPEGGSVVDVVDVVELMERANSALVKWFDLIPSVDVRLAMDAIKTNE